MANRLSTLACTIHHTVTPRDSSTMTGLRAIFKERFNVDYVGYNIVIFGDGRAESDIGDDGFGIHNNIGAYTNANSIGIALTGNFEAEMPTTAQLAKLASELDRVKAKYKFGNDRLFGHRDFKSTSCPGKNLYPWLQNYKQGGSAMAFKSFEKEQDYASNLSQNFQILLENEVKAANTFNAVEFWRRSGRPADQVIVEFSRSQLQNKTGIHTPGIVTPGLGSVSNAALIAELSRRLQ